MLTGPFQDSYILGRPGADRTSSNREVRIHLTEGQTVAFWAGKGCESVSKLASMRGGERMEMRLNLRDPTSERSQDIQPSAGHVDQPPQAINFQAINVLITTLC